MIKLRCLRILTVWLLILPATLAHAQNGSIEIDLFGAISIAHPAHPPVQVEVEAVATKPEERQLGRHSVWRINSAKPDGQGGTTMQGSLDLLPDPLKHTREKVLEPQPAARLQVAVSPVSEGIRYSVVVQEILVPDRIESLTLALHFQKPTDLVLMTNANSPGRPWKDIQENLGDDAAGKTVVGWKIESAPGLAGTLSAPANIEPAKNGGPVLRIPIEIKEGATASTTLISDQDAYSTDLRWDPSPPELHQALANPQGVTSLNGLRQEIPKEIGTLTDLERLGTGGVTLRELPDSIGDLKNLRDFAFSSGNDGGAGPPLLPDTLANCPELENILVYGNYQFFALPESLGQLSKLKELVICHTGLRTFPESIGECQDLWFIKCPDNPFTHFPDSLTKLKKLTFLDVAGANGQTRTIRALPENFGDLESLVFLHADGRYASLPESFSRLGALETLALQGNFPSLPRLTAARHLRFLNIRGTAELERLDLVMKDLPSLTYLSIQNSPLLTQLPEQISSADYLRFLDLGEAQLETLPPDLDQLPRLQILRVRPELSDQVQEIFPDWRKVPDTVNRWNEGTDFWISPKVVDLQIMEATIRRNAYSRVKGAFAGFPEFPEKIDLKGRGLGGTPVLRFATFRRDEPIPKLTSLDLSGNTLAGLDSESFALFKDLRELDLRGTGLTQEDLAEIRSSHPEARILTGDLPETAPASPSPRFELPSLMLSEIDFTPTAPEALREVDLGYNELRAVPQWILAAPNLSTLDLQMNRIDQLPENFGQLTNLKHLDLNSNRLVHLPEVISELTALESLDLSLNELEDLPQSLAKISSLRKLALAGNHLTQLPPDLSGLTSLEELDLRGNSLPDPEKQRIQAELPNTSILFKL